MSNKDNYKKAMDSIHASEELKNKTFQKIKNKPKKNLVFLKVLSICATFAIVFGIGASFNGNTKIIEIAKSGNKKTVQAEEVELPRFKNIEELKKVLAKKFSTDTSMLYSTVKGDSIFNSMDSSSADLAIAEGAVANTESMKQSERNDIEDYSTTNVQVENVDEADIVKTDGKYIYYVKDNMVYIVDSTDLKIINKLNFDEGDNDFIPTEIFINDDKLVVLGSSYVFDDDDDDSDYSLYSYYRYDRKTLTEAIVMDISDKENPKEEKRVSLDGYYNNSRMIGDNVYFISNKSIYYYKDLDDEDILPIYRDSIKGDDTYTINAEDIAYFKGTRCYSYMLVAGFNIKDKKEASIETIFGASDTVYASSENLYVVQEKYTSSGSRRSIIYKFELDDSKISLKAKGTVKGYMDNQFSMDEYDGNLRVATTAYVGGITKNQLYVLDKDLNKIGELTNMAINEKIYSVRFIGKIGYIVTFKQIDPLFVIDLSDPTNPEIKGELKIPGYSSYLHPYDDTHIIGIGYNTKENDYGGTVNKNMKMSMFDVSDLENPKEIFNIDIGDEYSYSEITSNHKALFYNKSKNLIGFPIVYRTDNYRKSEMGFTIFKIDLNKGFEKYGDITEKNNYENSPQRIIYIKDILYTIFEDEIRSYDLNTLDKKAEVELK